jgi:uncharacterized protein (DUF1778 family)
MGDNMSRVITTQKESRLNIRISPHQKDIITRAAALTNTTVSDFVLSHAYKAADRVVTDNARFRLSPEKWEAFCEALDKPSRSIPELVELVREPSVCHD